MDELFLEIEMRMDAALEATRREMSHVRTGRANPAILDKVVVEAYEQQMAGRGWGSGAVKNLTDPGFLWNVPGQIGAMGNRLLAPDEVNRMTPAFATGRSVKRNALLHYLKTRLWDPTWANPKKLYADLNEVADPGWDALSNHDDAWARLARPARTE